MEKGYYGTLLTWLKSLSPLQSQSTIKMEKGYYGVKRVGKRLYPIVSQSTIKMEKGYY